MKSRKWSLVESISNVLVGFGVAILGQIIIFPWFGMQVRLTDNLKIGGIFTVVSIMRSYGVRRMFNWMHNGGRTLRREG